MHILQDGFDLVTGAWVPRKSPSASLFLIADSRPLITRSVSIYVQCFAYSGANSAVDACCCVVLPVYDLCWLDSAEDVWCVS